MNDDRRLPSMEPFIGKRVIVTEKLDGENTSLYRDGLHARSIDSSRQYHESRDWIKKFHGSFAHEIPENWRICGENMYAKHSIAYDDLESFFYGFSVWDGEWSLPWDETVDVLGMLGIPHVPVIYDGVFDEGFLRELADRQDPTKEEGYVCAVADGRKHDPWFTDLAKYVRDKHVNTSTHWMTEAVIPNKLRGTP